MVLDQQRAPARPHRPPVEAPPARLRPSAQVERTPDHRRPQPEHAAQALWAPGPRGSCPLRPRRSQTESVPHRPSRRVATPLRLCGQPRRPWRILRAGQPPPLLSLPRHWVLAPGNVPAKAAVSPEFSHPSARLERPLRTGAPQVPMLVPLPLRLAVQPRVRFQWPRPAATDHRLWFQRLVALGVRKPARRLAWRALNALHACCRRMPTGPSARHDLAQSPCCRGASRRVSGRETPEYGSSPSCRHLWYAVTTADCGALARVKPAVLAV